MGSSMGGITMRRVALAAIVSVMAGVLTACPPQPPPGYRAPTIESIEVSPQPARPGDTLTVRIEARDDEAVTGVGVAWMNTPSSRLVGYGLCTPMVDPVGDPTDRTHVIITITCPVPTVASSGTWSLDVNVGDSYPPALIYPGRDVRIPFEVVDGSEDREPPRLLSYDIEPDVVDQETTFTVTMRLFDEAMPLRVGSGITTFSFSKLFADHSKFRCEKVTSTQVSPTELELVVQCEPWSNNVKGRAEAGLHRSRTEVRDALGHEGHIEMVVDVVPGPFD